MRFQDRFPTRADVFAATPEDLGVAIILHIKIQSAGFKFNVYNFPGSLEGAYGRSDEEFLKLIAEGVEWATQHFLLLPDLQGGSSGWMKLSRFGLTFDPTVDLNRIRLQKLLPEFLLHPKIRDASLPIFNIGRYEAAVFEAFKSVEIAIREASEQEIGSHGSPMVAKAFNPETGRLTDPDETGGEKQATMNFMAGAIGVFKNPRSHKSGEMADPTEAAEMLIVASHLLRIVEFRQAKLGR